MKLLLFLFLLFVFFIFLSGFSVLRILFGNLFSPKSKQKFSSDQSHTKSANAASSAKKIIQPDEGEYVDYEEIKD